MESRVPFVDLTRENEILRSAFSQDLESSLTESNFVLGSSLKEFEEMFANFVGSKYVIGVANGTDAIEIALRAHEIPKGSRVVVPAMTFAASAIGVSRAGMTPVFVDVDEDYGLIDIDLTEDQLKKGAKAIVAVHLYGQASQLKILNQLAETYGAIVMSDAAQAHGAMVDGKKLGEISVTSTYSFYPTKNLGALGDGGAIATSDQKVASRCASIRNYGSTKKYFHEGFGFNSRLDELQAKFLIAKLGNLEHTNELRRRVADYYLKELNEVEEINLPKVAASNEHVWHLFPIRYKKRDELLDKLASFGVGTAIHYPLALPDQEIYREHEYYYSKSSWARAWANEELSLPMHPYLTETEMKTVVEAVKQSCSDLN